MSKDISFHTLYACFLTKDEGTFQSDCKLLLIMNLTMMTIIIIIIITIIIIVIMIKSLILSSELMN